MIKLRGLGDANTDIANDPNFFNQPDPWLDAKSIAAGDSGPDVFGAIGKSFANLFTSALPTSSTSAPVATSGMTVKPVTAGAAAAMAPKGIAGMSSTMKFGLVVLGAIGGMLYFQKKRKTAAA